MVKLSNASREIAVQSKRLRQTVMRRNGLSKDLAVLMDPRAVGIQPRQHRIATRAAKRILAIRSLETNATTSQPINIGRLHERVVITPDGIVQVVRNDEQNIWTCLVRGREFP